MAYRVLIVDDSPAMRAFVRRVLSISGFDATEAFEAANGREALDLLRKEWVDVILTDVNMPEINGEEFLAILAADKLTDSVPVIVVSTDSTRARVERMLSLGARGYVAKPFLPEQLRAELEKVLGVPHA